MPKPAALNTASSPGTLGYHDLRAATRGRLAALAWLLMSVCYLPALRFYGVPWSAAPLLPLVALFYSGATVHSAIAYWRGAGGMWKGRVQDA